MPSGKNVRQLLTFDLLVKIALLHALLAATMTNILLVISADLQASLVPGEALKIY